MVANAGLRGEGVTHLDVVVEKNPIPGDQHVVEHADRVGFLETSAERMIPFRLHTGVERLAANEAKTWSRGGNTEGQDVTLLALANAGERVNQKFIGRGAVGRQHLGGAHAQSVGRLVDDSEVNKGIVLLVRTLRAVALRIDNGMGEEQVAVTALAVIIPDVLRELLA